jgi:hypothetical protein
VKMVLPLEPSDGGPESRVTHGEATDSEYDCISRVGTSPWSFYFVLPNAQKVSY